MYTEKDPQKIINWLTKRHLFYAPIANGHYGMVYKDGGGVAVYLNKKVLDKMVTDGYLYKSPKGSYWITAMGCKKYIIGGTRG